MNTAHITSPANCHTGRLPVVDGSVIATGPDPAGFLFNKFLAYPMPLNVASPAAPARNACRGSKAILTGVSDPLRIQKSSHPIGAARRRGAYLVKASAYRFFGVIGHCNCAHWISNPSSVVRMWMEGSDLPPCSSVSIRGAMASNARGMSSQFSFVFDTYCHPLDIITVKNTYLLQDSDEIQVRGQCRAR